MSTKYPGGIISKTAPTPSGPYSDSTAPGIWTLEQQAYWQKLGQWPTAGAVNPNAFIENLFSTYLYTGNDATTTISNGLNLSTNGGLVWVKARGNGNRSHTLFDSATYTNGQYYLATNVASGFLDTGTPGTFALNSSGFSVTGTSAQWNASTQLFASWSFRKQSKFFDIVTWTGNGVAGRQIPHNLGSVPGCIIVRNLELGTNWTVYHRGADATAPQDYEFYLDATNARISSTAWDNTAPTSTYFTVGSGNEVNRASSLNTYVAYIFAHDAGGFGLSGSENVISCGSFTTDGSGNATVNLGYEPQWALVKRTDSAGTWWMMDTMRGWTASTGNNFQYLQAQSAAVEGAAGTVPVNATGFTVAGNNFSTSATYIYIAIRRGPMAIPTVGTSVFYPNAYTGNSTDTTITSTGFPPDLFYSKIRQSDSGFQNMMFDKLRGAGQYLIPTSTDAEGASSNIQLSFNMTGVTLGVGSNVNNSGSTYAQWNFRRAPGFFDEVCYTGNGSVQNVTHNLTVVPELMIVKNRTTATYNWFVYLAALGNDSRLLLNTTAASSSGSFVWDYTSPTSSVFTVGASSNVNGSAEAYVNYLFATCAGVSKVGSYTGNGSSQTIACGFTAGSRFVLIKRTDSTGDWYVWDSARGIVAGNDPHLSLNTTAAEVTTDDSVDTDNSGFIVNQVAATNVNVTSATYIFLAIA